MEELLEKLKTINNLSELGNLKEIDSNELLLGIIETKRFSLLEGYDVHFNLDNRESFGRLAEKFLSDYAFYDMRKYGFSLSQQDVNALFLIVKDDYNSSQFNKFFELFYSNAELLNNVVIENEEYFRSFLNVPNVDMCRTLKYSDHFIKLIIEEKVFKLIDFINDADKYSAEHLKMIAQYLQTSDSVPSTLTYGRESFVSCLFSLKEEFSSDEFYNLLMLLNDKYFYDGESGDSQESVFTSAIKKNFDFLLNILEGKEFLPKCLIESTVFRDECIKRSRFDLAVQCLLPENIFQDENIINGYAQILNVSSEVLHARIKWVANYYKKNNNLFNSMLGSSLKEDIFNLNKNHFERFVNDVDIQQSLAKLNSFQLKVVSKILDSYSFKDYDLSLMITNIITNIHSYNQLINSLDVDSLTDKQFKNLVRTLQNPNNPYNTNTLFDLDNYLVLKKKFLVDNFPISSLEENKNNLLQAIFNISLDEGWFIYDKFCHNSEMLEILKDSELPQENVQQLLLIGKILGCNDNTSLASIYNQLQGESVYASELPLATYLKSVYSNLFSLSIYDPDKRDQIYGPKEHIMSETSYNGKNIQVCIPRANFNCLVHVVGTCSLSGEVTDTNYANDWLDRPLMQDHFVCCSYISEQGVFSLRDGGSILYGFDQFEDGALLTMGNGDIDSTGISRDYNGARVMENLNPHAKYYVPSELTKASIAKGEGYNEVVLERRDENIRTKEFAKRKPSYIVMPVSSMSGENFTLPEDLYQGVLSFISIEDRQEISRIIHSEQYDSVLKKEISKVLVKYKEIINQRAIEKNIALKVLAYHYIDLIKKAYGYEEYLKASSDFDIPLVIIDREYYFRRMLAGSGAYGDEMKPAISALYDSYTDDRMKKELYFKIQKGEDISQFLPPVQSQTLAD